MAKLGQYAEVLEFLTEQEVFQILTRHLLEQGDKSVKSHCTSISTCAYRGENGTCCPAAVFAIPDNIRENEEWKDIAHTDAHLEMIGVFQDIHDLHKPAEWFTKIIYSYPNMNYKFMSKVKIHSNCKGAKC